MSVEQKKIWLPIVILVAGLVLTVVMIRSRKPAATSAPADYAPLVRTMVAVPEAVTFQVHAHGTVTPRTETALVGEVSGRVIDVAPAFASGGFFDKGDVLVSIDPVDYELAVVAAKSQVAQAKVRAQTEEAMAEVAREEWEALGDGSDSPLATRELQVEEARAALAAALGALRQAERNLERTRVRAPYRCRVRQKGVDIGQYVTPGVVVALVFATDYAEVRLPIPDSDLAFLDLPVDFRATPGRRGGPAVTLRADFGGALREWQGRIARVEGEIDPRTGMVHVVAQVDDPYRRLPGHSVLPAGLFVSAEIAGRTVERAVTVPRSALRGENIVLVVDGDDRIRFRTVVVARTNRDNVVVASGLDRGERVCISALDAVTDGMRVRWASDADSTAVPEITGGTR